MEITVRYSKTAMKDPNIVARLQRPMAIALAMAEHIRTRVRDQGRTATPVEPYSTRQSVKVSVTRRTASGGRSKAYEQTRTVGARAKYYVSPWYAEKLGITQTRYNSSAEFHRGIGTKEGAFKVTGQMWAGLQTRNYGADGAIIDFGGSSLGSSSVRSKLWDKKARKYKRVQIGTTDNGIPIETIKTRQKPKLVRNAHKAAAVYRHSKVGLLQPTEAEFTATSEAVTAQAQKLVAEAFGSHPERFTTQGDRELFSKILRRFS